MFVSIISDTMWDLLVYFVKLRFFKVVFVGCCYRIDDKFKDVLKEAVLKEEETDSLQDKNCLYTRSNDTQSHTLDTRLRHHSRSLVEWDCHSMGFVLIFHANVRANQKSKKNSGT